MGDSKIDLSVTTSVAVIRAMTDGDTEKLYLLLEQYLTDNNLQLPKPLIGPDSKTNIVDFSHKSS